MPPSFTASAISNSPVDGVLTIAFLEKPSGEGRFLLLQRDLHASTPDKAGDYLELDGKARSARCGIEAVVVHWGRLRFILNAEGRHRIGVPEFTIAHELKLAELGRLFSTLTRIVGEGRVRHAAPSIEEVNRLLHVEGEDPDAYGRFDLFVPAFGRSFAVHLDLIDASGIAPGTAANPRPTAPPPPPPPQRPARGGGRGSGRASPFRMARMIRELAACKPTMHGAAGDAPGQPCDR